MKKLMELCKTGAHNSGGRIVTITKKDLSDAVKTFKGSVPWAVSHQQDEKLPKLASVESVVLSDDGNTLMGVVEWNKLGEKLFNDKLFDSWSAGLVKNAEGEYYLHHMAALGGVPPAIKDLKFLDSLDLSSLDLETVQFSEAAGEVEMILLSSPASINHKEKDDMAESIEDLKEDLEKEKQKTATLEEQNSKLLSDKQAVEKEQRAEAVKRIKEAAQGKIPAGKIPELIALADSLPTDEVEVEGDDGKKEKVSPVTILERLLKGLKDLLDEGEALNLSDNPKLKSSSKEEDLSGLMACM